MTNIALHADFIHVNVVNLDRRVSQQRGPVLKMARRAFILDGSITLRDALVAIRAIERSAICGDGLMRERAI